MIVGSAKEIETAKQLEADGGASASSSLTSPTKPSKPIRGSWAEAIPMLNKNRKKVKV